MLEDADAADSAGDDLAGAGDVAVDGSRAAEQATVDGDGTGRRGERSAGQVGAAARLRVGTRRREGAARPDGHAPALLNAPGVVRFRPPWIVKLADAVLVAKFRKASRLL